MTTTGSHDTYSMIKEECVAQDLTMPLRTAENLFVTESLRAPLAMAMPVRDAGPPDIEGLPPVVRHSPMSRMSNSTNILNKMGE